MSVSISTRSFVFSIHSFAPKLPKRERGRERWRERGRGRVRKR
jgi:hypothetical protein